MNFATIRVLIIFLIGAVINGGFYAYSITSLESRIAEAIDKQNYLNEYYKNRPYDASMHPAPLTLLAREEGELIEFNVPQEILEKWIQKYKRLFTGETEFRIDLDLVESYLKSLEPEVYIQPINARLKFSETDKKVEIFRIHKVGHQLDIEESLKNIYSGLRMGRNSINLATKVLIPEITIDSIENLGINTLLARGESNFTGSSLARIHNIKISSAIYHGILIAPDEIFSFNDLLGPVDAHTGYQYELIIKGNKLIPEYGGGICQVSTTVFRAAVKAGLPIIERRAHSLPVRYYDPQGFDATIYPGVTDLRFENNTSAPILVQTMVSGTKLYIDFYGSSDGRKVEISGPIQYDIKPDGAIKTFLTRIITLADGEQVKDTFYSNYKSPELFETERNPLE